MISNKNDLRKKSGQPKKKIKTSTNSDKKIKKMGKIMKSNPPKDLDFQIVDWNTYHEIDGDEEERYVIQLFGRTEDDKDVCLKVTGFKPFFYVEVPLNWTQGQVNEFIEVLKKKVAWNTENNPNYDYDLSNSLVNYKIVQKHKFYNFHNKKFFKYVMLVFKSHTAMREFANILARPLKADGLTKEPMLYQRYESNIEPHIRFMHIQNLSSCGWVTVDGSKLKEDRDYSDCDHSYVVDWKYIKPSENDNRMAPLKIMAYDIECVSSDHNFPQAERENDKIIQIGNTVYRYGSMKCEEQYILTLKECAPIEGANVQCYKTEKGLIRGWAQLIRKIRPDIRTNYNGFNFDDKYIFDRIMRIDREQAKKQNTTMNYLQNRFIDEILQILGKVNNKYLVEMEGIDRTMQRNNTNQSNGSYYGPSLSYFELKNLSSSALGDNELKFFQIPGIIATDMMKVIMRDHRLVGYKLDNVSANFITEGAIKFVEEDKTDDCKIKMSIYTRSTKALEKNSFIQIMVDDGYSSTPLSEGAKYQVFDIETVVEKKEKNGKPEILKYQAIKTAIGEKDIIELREVLLNPMLKVFWTFAKDDMHHTQINKYFNEGDPEKIKQIAIYCLKDCKLANLLMAKLEIIVNSVGMAKVCHVPLSYLFLRGQGVKIFSLVAKECRENNFLIPVLRKKKKDTEGDNDETYEGATVITPKPDVYLSPISVLDYSSLYPNSMRERNLSHECYVSDPQYNNLPGYIYHDIDIILKDKKGRIRRNIDGTPMKERHRFAQELVTEEQINEELKDIFNSIRMKMKENIDRIKIQDYWTDEQKKQKILDPLKAEYLLKVKEIKKNVDLPEEERSKQLEKEKNLFEEKEEEIKKNKYKMTEKDKEEFIKFEEENCKKKIAAERAKRYNVVNGQWVRYGILPTILTKLLNKRKETNAQLEEAKEKDPAFASILNGLQLAYKITANSLYGQTGAPTSPIFFLAIAASTTATGRERLHYAKNMVEKNFPGSEVIYGDSVTGDTPIIYRDSSKNINITTIEKLGQDWKPYEQFKPNDPTLICKEQSNAKIEVWTSTGWRKVKRIIRHKTNKKIYRVSTPTGCIDVTEDHSLLDTNKKQIKPKDCVLGTELLHGFMPVNNGNTTISDDKIFSAGFYLHMAKTKEIPKEILNGNIRTKYSFLLPYLLMKQSQNELSPGCIDYLIDGSDENTPYFIENITDKLETQNIYYLLKSLNFHVQIHETNDTYQLELNTKKLEDNKRVNFVRYLRTINYHEYVYDLETEDGTFHAGIGEMIVKNTDSIFINFHLKDESGQERTDKKALVESIALAQKAAKLINDNVPKPQAIVYEKTFHPFILVAKKKYVGLLFEEDPYKYYLKSMGIVLKRRDNAPIVKIVVGGIIDHLLKNRDIDKAVEYTKKVIRKLMDGKYPIDKFIISKTLKAKYKKPSTIAHKVLADRMAARDPGNKPQINDRIPFVYVVKDFGKKKKKDILQGDLIEHPDYVVKNGLKIDYLYYLEHQIINPASQILELIMPAKDVRKLFQAFIIEEDNKRKGRQSLEKWMIGVKSTGSKTSKKPYKSLKIMKTAVKSNGYDELSKVKKHECQDMNKWLQVEKSTYSDDWEPTVG